MISTVTTTTVSTVTASMVSMTFGAGLALVSVLVLFALLIQKELSVSTGNLRLKALGRAVDIAPYPLMLAFAMIAVARIVQVLR